MPREGGRSSLSGAHPSQLITSLSCALPPLPLLPPPLVELLLPLPPPPKSPPPLFEKTPLRAENVPPTPASPPPPRFFGSGRSHGMPGSVGGGSLDSTESSGFRDRRGPPPLPLATLATETLLSERVFVTPPPPPPPPACSAFSASFLRSCRYRALGALASGDTLFCRWKSEARSAILSVGTRPGRIAYDWALTLRMLLVGSGFAPCFAVSQRCAARKRSHSELSAPLLF